VEGQKGGRDCNGQTSQPFQNIIEGVKGGKREKEKARPHGLKWDLEKGKQTLLFFVLNAGSHPEKEGGKHAATLGPRSVMGKKKGHGASEKRSTLGAY